MRFFSKIVVICNLCFIASVILRMVEHKMIKNGNNNALIPLPWAEASIVVLGFIVAILINAAFVFIVLYRKSIRKHVPVSMYIILFNMLLLPVEIWYQFIYRY